MRADGRSPRRIVLLALVAGLSVAAVVAIAAILTGSFDSVDLRAVATSLGFSVFSALGASGTRTRGAGRWGALGVSTTAAAALTYGLLLVALWITQEPLVWRSLGTLAIMTLALSHACLVLGSARTTDSPLIRRLMGVSVAAAAVDSVIGGLAIVGVVGHLHSGYLRLLGVLVIVMLLTTALPPLLRRLQRSGDDVSPTGSPPDPTASASASPPTELLAIADQLDGLMHNGASGATQIGSCAAQLRRIARRLEHERYP